MEIQETFTLEKRLEHLFADRTDDAITGVSRDILIRVHKARDEWLKERLSEEDFKHYWRLMYAGPAGDEFPRGWEDAEIRAEIAKLEAAYRQGLQDGARLLAMLLGLLPLPQYLP